MKKALILSTALLMAACTSSNEVYKGYDNQGCNYYDENGNCISRRYSSQTYYTANQEPVRIVRPRQNVQVYQQPHANSTLLASSPCGNGGMGPMFGNENCGRQTQPAPRPEPILVQQAPVNTVSYVAAAPTPCAAAVPCTVSPCPASPCPSTVREVKEPVEITYKKTTYTTVYNPQTYQSVSYEKQPYSATVVTTQPVNVITAAPAAPATVAVVNTHPVSLVDTTPTAVLENEILIPENEIK